MSSIEISVAGRRIGHSTDAAGCRPVSGQPRQAERTLAIYGCSVAFGWCVLEEETVASLLQAGLPQWRVENHGVNGYGTVHNLLALQRNARWSTPDIVTFLYYNGHRVRNVADAAFVIARTPPDVGATMLLGGTQITPRAALDEAGQLVLKPVAVPRPDLVGINLADFVPDPYYMDLVGFRLIAKAADLVRQAGGHFFLTVVREGLSAALTAWLDEAAIPVVDASLPSQAYTYLPIDEHPNAAGHRFYAERIDQYLAAHEVMTRRRKTTLRAHRQQKPGAVS